jgi:hypothetical protein
MRGPSEPMWGQPPSAVRRAQPGLWLGVPHPCRVLCDRVGRGVLSQKICFASVLSVASILYFTACSPRDLLSRRLAADLISASDAFKTPQQYVLKTGIVPNKDYISPEYLVLQHHGWISATTITCPPGQTPPPCWDILLTPMGVDTVRAIVPAEEAGKPSISIPVARREFVSITGISKQVNEADVDFTWHWVPLNEIGAALYSSAVQYKSTVGFRDYDDGWRLLQNSPRPSQTLDDALKNAEPAP